MAYGAFTLWAGGMQERAKHLEAKEREKVDEMGPYGN